MDHCKSVLKKGFHERNRIFRTNPSPPGFEPQTPSSKTRFQQVWSLYHFADGSVPPKTLLRKFGGCFDCLLDSNERKINSITI